MTKPILQLMSKKHEDVSSNLFMLTQIYICFFMFEIGIIILETS